MIMIIILLFLMFGENKTADEMDLCKQFHSVLFDTCFNHTT